ncbi:hypothetical protein VTK56DRAFT_1935 [Thermocarpiscus australiensis]
MGHVQSASAPEVRAVRRLPPTTVLRESPDLAGCRLRVVIVAPVFGLSSSASQVRARKLAAPCPPPSLRPGCTPLTQPHISLGRPTYHSTFEATVFRHPTTTVCTNSKVIPHGGDQASKKLSYSNAKERQRTSHRGLATCTKTGHTCRLPFHRPPDQKSAPG